MLWAARRPSRVRSRIRSRSISAAMAATMNSILSAMVAPSGRLRRPKGAFLADLNGTNHAFTFVLPLPARRVLPPSRK